MMSENNFSKPITLFTNRLIIKDLKNEDLNFVHLIHSIPEVQEYATLGIPKSISESKEYLKKYMEHQNCYSRMEYGFCISLTNHEQIGSVVKHLNHQFEFLVGGYALRIFDNPVIDK